MTFGPGKPRVDIRREDGVFWAPGVVAATVAAAGHTRLDHGDARSDPPPVQETTPAPSDAADEDKGEGEGEDEAAETGSEPSHEAPAREDIQTANRNQAWSMVKDADPDEQLGLEYAGEGAAGADEMRTALLEYYGYDDASEE